MATTSKIELPEGFVLDKPQAPPSGFVLDKSVQTSQLPEGFILDKPSFPFSLPFIGKAFERIEAFGQALTGAATRIPRGLVRYEYPEELKETKKYLKRTYPIISTVGEIAGGTLPYIATTTTGIPLPIAFGTIDGLEELAKQVAIPEELNLWQKTGRVGVASAAGAITGTIFREASLGKTAISRILQRAGGAGTTTFTENITKEFISKKKPSISSALAISGIQATTIGILGLITEIPALRSAVFREAQLLSKKTPSSYAEAIEIVKSAGINPERLSPEFQRTMYDMKRKIILKDIDLYAKKHNIPVDLAKEIIYERNVRLRSIILDRWLWKLSKVNPTQARALAPFSEAIAKGADPIDILIGLEVNSMVKTPPTVTKIVEPTPSPVVPPKPTLEAVIKPPVVPTISPVAPVVPPTVPIRPGLPISTLKTELLDMGFYEKEILRATDEAVREIIRKGLTPEQVSILPNGELKIIKPELKPEVDRGTIPGEPIEIYKEQKAALFDTEEGKYYIQREDGSYIRNPKTGDALFDKAYEAKEQLLKEAKPEIKPLIEGEKITSFNYKTNTYKIDEGKGIGKIASYDPETKTLYYGETHGEIFNAINKVEKRIPRLIDYDVVKGELKYVRGKPEVIAPTKIIPAKELPLDKSSQELLNLAKGQLTPQKLNVPEVLKSASKIAQLDKNDIIQPYHLSEAIQYHGNANDFIRNFIEDEWGNYSGYTVAQIERRRNQLNLLLDRAEEILGGNLKQRVNAIVDEFMTVDTTKMSVSKIQNFLEKLKKKYIGKVFAPTYPSGIAGLAEYMEDFVPKEHTSKVEMPELVKLAKELLGNIPIVTRLKRNLGLFIGKLPPKIKLRPDIFKNPFLAGQVLAHEIGHLVDWLPTHILARGGLLNRLLTVKNFIQSEFGSLKELAIARKERIEEVGATNKEIKEELIKATIYWHPFDPNLNPSYTNLRYQAKELYADALSMLLIQPEKLEELAPKFYSAFWKFIDRKPEVKQALLELQDFLALGEGEKLRIRSQDIRNMFKKGEELFYEKRTQYQAQQKSLYFRLKTELIDKNTAILNKLKQAEKQGKKINPEDNPTYYLEDWNYIGGKVKNLLEKINTDVITPLTAQGITQDDLGEYLFLQRVVTERKDIANPLGHNRETAQKQLDYLLEKLGQEKFDLLKTSVDKFQIILKNLLDEGNKIGFFKPETFAEIITNPAYATFQVLDYLDDYVTPAIIHQIGTLKGIANPFASTTLKMISTLRAIERVKTNNSIIKFMQENFPAEIQSAKIRRFGKYKAEVVEKESYGIIKTREDGKLRGYYVDPYIADSVNYQPRARTNAVLSIFKFLNRSYFRPVYVNLNLGFQTFNLMRDFVRAWKLNPDVNFPQMLKKYTEAMPIARKRIWGNFTDPIITEMQQSGMLSFTYNNLMRGIENEETEIEFLMKQYDILKKNPQNPIMKVFNAIEELGDFIETLPKVTGYLSRVKSGRNIKEIAHEVRVFSGSPDFLRKGAGYDWYNNVFLFSNAFKEGFRGDYEGAFKNPRTRSGYWWRTAKLNLLPKILMFLGVLGLFGKRIKDNYDKQTEFDKTNYTTIPLGETEQGKAIYLRIPNDEAGRLVSGILWKVLNFKKSNILNSIQQISALTAGQLPSLSPEVDLAIAISQYAVGQNPYDFFRGRTVLTNDEMKAGGWYSLKPMLRWIAGKLGVYGLTIRAKRDDQTPFEKFVQWMPIIQRYIRITAYGEEEKLREERLEREQFKARRRLRRR